MEKSTFKIDDAQILRVVARELRDIPKVSFVNDDESSLTINFANEKNMLGTFLLLHKDKIAQANPEVFQQTLEKLHSL